MVTLKIGRDVLDSLPEALTERQAGDACRSAATEVAAAVKKNFRAIGLGSRYWEEAARVCAEAGGSAQGGGCHFPKRRAVALEGRHGEADGADERGDGQADEVAAQTVCGQPAAQAARDAGGAAPARRQHPCAQEPQRLPHIGGGEKLEDAHEPGMAGQAGEGGLVPPAPGGVAGGGGVAAQRDFVQPGDAQVLRNADRLAQALYSAFSRERR